MINILPNSWFVYLNQFNFFNDESHINISKVKEEITKFFTLDTDDQIKILPEDTFQIKYHPDTITEVYSLEHLIKFIKYIGYNLSERKTDSDLSILTFKSNL